MQGGRGGRHGLFGFGDPFAGFGGFGRPGSLMSSFLGGVNPFDDPFFTNPFGSMMQPSLLGPSLFGPQGGLIGGMSNAGMFGPIIFGPQGDLNQGMNNAGRFIQQAPEPSRPKGPIIKELSSDDEDDASGDKEDEKQKGNFRKHPRTSKEPYVEDPDEEAEDNKRPKYEQFGREFNRVSTSQPQPQTFMFQSSTVTFGGPNGVCYTSSAARRSGGDGITFDESKEANTATGKATHRISRGIGSKGHSLTRKLNSDGHVNTLQTLHNLNEDELHGFEESWQRNARENLPGRDPRMNMLGSGSIHPDFQGANKMLALPAPNQTRGSNSSRNSQNGSSKGRSRRT
ncbi:uncharacterized protein LOC133899004 isoform X2 [Phragmites australis]|uniref:uncharacterized protein LOC133899004 isoform X2 n=1 Tax=Phragmites australis TaxID=29695 RepID=UPI002D7919A5|nr:uncharacterized protein LOC133899004 isoform X2 [Phragmites australis]